ncbi:DUF4369 domain-containing protein [Aegicerativicinus sediminis]|uniref:DUF4369 domain-containing protein n=1 Tax=Aegicerativicinus sediminis TaxID=2893202 RepID=UPI001E35175D|nr:DUF4369 domain-containing protein [Aegicerativicinus sediminis]
MKQVVAAVALLILFGCKEETNFTLEGQIKGLKKGVVYLERFQDSTYNVIDSVVINGNENFTIKTQLEEPEVLFLRLDKNSKEDDLVSFFADEGITKVSSTLKNFYFDASIEGTKQQQLLEDYLKMMGKFNDENLDLIKSSIQNNNNSDSINKIDYQSKFDQLIRRKYLYTINFAVNNRGSEVAPYLAVYEIPDANIKLLDTIYNSLPEKIKTSKYGKELETVLKQRKNDSL